MRSSFLESATASRQWLIKATKMSNRSDNMSVCLDKTVVAESAADEPAFLVVLLTRSTLVGLVSNGAG